jgi:Leucine-rich repeat (LRR) protein
METILASKEHSDLSCNNLSGEIPDRVTSLPGLIGLNLSHNQWTGMIPPNIGLLKSLESLDLSTNQLCSFQQPWD